MSCVVVSIHVSWGCTKGLGGLRSAMLVWPVVATSSAVKGASGPRWRPNIWLSSQAGIVEGLQLCPLQ